MCHRVRCSKCGKPTWSGCGMHVEQALAGIPKADRCHCREQGSTPRKATATASGTAKPWWTRVLGG